MCTLLFNLTSVFSMESLKLALKMEPRNVVGHFFGFDCSPLGFGSSVFPLW